MEIKKRIGIVLPNHPSYSETFFVSKIKGLQLKGFEVVLFLNASKNKSFKLCPVVYLKTKFSNINFVTEFILFIAILVLHSKNAIKLYTLNKKDKMSGYKNMKNLFLNRYFLNQKLDWLHFGFGTMALERENVAAAINTKMAVSFRGFDWYVYPLKNVNCYQKLFKKQVKYHVLSEGMKEDLMKNDIEEVHINVISPSIDIVQFNPSQKDFLRRGAELKLISVGRLHWIKGYGYILEALAILKTKGINFSYSIVGEGIEKERLMFQAYQLGILDNITFYGKVDHDELVKVLQMHDIFIQYSNQEGFCNAALEAQSSSLLCIVSDADGLRENVIDGETGWVVPKRNPKALSNKIIEIISLAGKEKDKIKEKARNRVAVQFNLEKHLKEFVFFYVS